MIVFLNIKKRCSTTTLNRISLLLLCPFTMKSNLLRQNQRKRWFASDSLAKRSTLLVLWLGKHSRCECYEKLGSNTVCAQQTLAAIGAGISSAFPNHAVHILFIMTIISQRHTCRILIPI